jgi:3-deoxy-7-phosphoheptulonate synthase
VVEVKTEDGKSLGFGDGQFQVIAGPCSVESYEQVLGIAKAVKKAGATLLRGGAFKPRTSPRSFQGLGIEGLKILSSVKHEVGIPTVSELMAIEDLPHFEDIDIIQVGARNMQNFRLLKELGSRTKKPIILKRGLSATIKELVLAAEYILDAGNSNVILCERGIRTFETEMRNTLDLGIVPVVHRLSRLPIIVDPSHASGLDYIVEPMSKAALAANADGLLIEVHYNPKESMCDAKQTIDLDTLDSILKSVKKI